MTQILTNVKIDQATASCVGTPNPNSPVSKSQVENMIAEKTFKKAIIDAVVDNSGDASSIAGKLNYTVQDTVMAFEVTDLAGITTEAGAIYQCTKAGTLSTAEFAAVTLVDGYNILAMETLQHPTDTNIFLQKGNIYRYNSANTGFARWEYEQIVDETGVAAQELEVSLTTSGTFDFTKLVPAGKQVGGVLIRVTEAINGTVGTGSITIGRTGAQTEITDMSIFGGFATNLQALSVGDIVKKDVFASPLGSNTELQAYVTAPTGATTGKVLVRVSYF